MNGTNQLTDVLTVSQKGLEKDIFRMGDDFFIA